MSYAPRRRPNRVEHVDAPGHGAWPDQAQQLPSPGAAAVLPGARLTSFPGAGARGMNTAAGTFRGPRGLW